MHELLKKAMELQKESVEIRKELHENPELPFQEYRTSELVKRELDAMGVSWHSVGETGIVAVIEGTKAGEGSHAVGLRADMDALEIKEETGVPFASKTEGVMHACGHDVHTTSLLTAAKLLQGARENFFGKVKCIFQPAEELVSGAVYMMERDKFMEDVEKIITFHVNPKYPVGTMAFRDGGALVAGEMFRIIIEGKSGHGARPHTAVDALLAASAVVLNSQAIISRETDPLESAVVTICTMESGTRHNIIAGRAEMKGTIRCYSVEKRWELRAALDRMVEKTAEVYGAKGHVEWSMYVPPVINDEAIGKIIRKTAAEICAEENVLAAEADTGSDDFAYYEEKIPGYYVFAGCASSGQEAYLLHHPKCLPDENCIPYIAANYAAMAIDLLEKESLGTTKK